MVTLTFDNPVYWTVSPGLSELNPRLDELTLNFNSGSGKHGSINSLWPSDTIWRHRAESTLFQVMAYCLIAPSHLKLNQCWLIISEVLWHPPEGYFSGNVQEIYPWYVSLKIYNLSLCLHNDLPQLVQKPYRWTVIEIPNLHNTRIDH